MRQRTLILVAACLSGISASAQWTGDEPTLPSLTASELVSGHYYQITNTSQNLAGLCLQGGETWYGWDTSLIVGERSQAITYLLESSTPADNNGAAVWTLKNTSTGLYTFVSGLISATAGSILSTYNGLGELHVDMGDQGHQYFEIIKASDSPTYNITVAADDDTYSAYSGSGFLGVMPAGDYGGIAVYAFLNPTTEGNCCEWTFVDMTVYVARLDLYNALVESNDYPNIDASVVSAASSVYYDDNATAEELEQATEKVVAARNSAVTGGATQDDPADVTYLIENCDFSYGNSNGWTCTFEKGVNTTNIGYQGGYEDYDATYTNSAYTYENHEGVEVNPKLSGFIEAWVDNASHQWGSAEVANSLGDGLLSQTLSDMPAGNYKLSADVIAVQQYETVNQHGVQLFASDEAGNDFYEEISTADGIPEHTSIFFYTSGGTLTIGLRTSNTNCNWMAADNFEMLYYGDESSAYYFQLSETINECEAAYPDVDELHANADLKDAYIDALQDARDVLNAGSTDEEMLAATNALSEAADALGESASEYAVVAPYLEYILSVESQASDKGWDGLAESLSEYRSQTLEEGYDNGTLTNEVIDQMETVVSGIISDYITGNCKAGDDISLIINNNDFDTDFSGWTVSGSTPAWGGSASYQPENEVTGGTLIADINSGCAEVYHKAFDISQVLKQLPQGLYTLSCYAFERDDESNGIDAELYAQIEGQEEQTQKIKDLYDEGSPTQLYSYSQTTADAWGMDTSKADKEVTLNDGTTGWVPNGMNGADIYFYNGYYYNSFSILLNEATDVTIGLRNTNDTDWVLFDNFRLVYQGNSTEAYQTYLTDLMAQALALEDAIVMTEDASAQLEAAIAEGKAALSGNDADAALQAIETLRDAMAYANSTAETVSRLQYLYDYTTEIRCGDLEDAQQTAPTYTAFNDLLATVKDALSAASIPSVEQAEEWMTDLKSQFSKYAQSAFTTASEDSPADITTVILNPDYNIGEAASDFGWDENGNIGLAHSAAEIYDQGAGASLSQTLYALRAGYYRLHVQGFYRGVGIVSSIDTSLADSIDAIRGADIFAGENATRMSSIISDAAAYDNLYGKGVAGTWTVPESMDQAGKGFDEGLYADNTLQFQVEADDTDVVIGVRKTGHRDEDWAIFGRWTLEYLGTAEPSEDTTTAIVSTDGTEESVSQAIYTIDGKRAGSLTKGINIVKSTMADGSVRVAKVLVR